MGGGEKGGCAGGCAATGGPSLQGGAPGAGSAVAAALIARGAASPFWAANWAAAAGNGAMPVCTMCCKETNFWSVGFIEVLN